MKKFRLLVLLIFLSSFAIAQNVKGIIYEDNTTAKRILVNNTTQNIKTYSVSDGSFSIKAKINDTLIFGSLFHKTQKVVLKPEHFNEIIVVQLKKVVNELNEVHISNEPVVKEFEAMTYSENIKNQIKEDIKQRPYLYGYQPNSNIDFVAIGKLIGKLFKRKKPKQEKILPITYNDLKLLFESDSFFNEDMLFNRLNIPPDFKYLFFEYCEAQQLNKTLLKNDTNFLLLDALMTCSMEFLKILKDHKKD